MAFRMGKAGIYEALGLINSPISGVCNRKMVKSIFYRHVCEKRPGPEYLGTIGSRSASISIPSAISSLFDRDLLSQFPLEDGFGSPDAHD